MVKTNQKKMGNKGFSLVELIVVIAIMAVLVGVLAPQLIKYVEKSREATDIQNCDSIASTLKSYYSDKEDVTTVTIKITKDAELGTEDPAIKDAGLNSTKLKGNWDGDEIDISYDNTTGQVTYTKASSDYYEISDDGTSIVAK